MTDDLVRDFEGLLRRAEAGERISISALRSEFPATWKELHELLVLEGWLRHDETPPERIGAFRVLGRLGEGGTAVAYVAEVVEPRFGLAAGQVVCLKVLERRALAAPRAIERLEREAAVGSAVRHPNVVRVFGLDAGHGEGQPAAYLVQECVEGLTLREQIGESGPLSDDATRRLVADLAAGLSAIHAAGAVHRDLKPENVLMASDGTARILDLGVVRVAGQTTVGTSARFIGSVRYASPEQYEVGAKTSAASDLFALGVVAHEARSGGAAFPQRQLAALREAVLACNVKPLAEAAPGVSPFLAALVGALLRRVPAERLGPAELVARIAAEGEASAWWQAHRA